MRGCLIAVGALIVLSLFFVSDASATTAWWNSTWLLRREVTVTNPNATTSYSNFTFPIQLNNAITDCAGMRVTDINNNILPFEFENSSDPIYGCTNKTLIFVSGTFPTGQ